MSAHVYLRRFIRHRLLEMHIDTRLNLYTYVPPDALDVIMDVGLLSGDELYKRPSMLKLARPNEDDRDEWSQRYEAAAASYDPFFSGIHVFFTPPDFDKLHPDHFILKWSLRPIMIDLDMMLDDDPKLQLLGLELQPARSDDRIEDLEDRERYLSIDEVIELTSRSPEDLWQHHEGRATHYASNVPHAIIMTPRIDPKYLTIM